MAVLEAGVAFAVLMIVFSTIATSIVELIHKLLGTRATHLKRAVGYLFESIIWPRLGQNLPRLSDQETDEQAKARHAEMFVTLLTANPISVLRGKDNLSIARQSETSETLAYGTVKQEFPGRDIDYLTPLSFAERLGRTEVGKVILDEGEEFVEDLVTDFVRSFDRLSRAGTDFVRNRARAVSLVVGIGLALTVNIDAGRLITTLIDNPDLRQGVTSEADRIIQANQQAEEKLVRTVRDLADKKEGISKEEVEESLDQIRVRLDELKAYGLPIGYDYYPWAEFGACPVGHWPCALDERNEVPRFLRWLFMCILSGVLIGLGGPFWYEVFGRLSQITRIVRSLGLGGSGKPEKAGNGVSDDSPVDRTISTGPIDSFLAAANVHRAGMTSVTGSVDVEEQGRRALDAGLVYASRNSATKPDQSE